MSSDTARIDNSKRNIKFATIFQLSSAVLGFVERYFFILCLSSEYLGLKGLITSILMVLSITEFGISSSLAFYLYAPLVNKDTEKIKSLNQYIRKIYHQITLIVLFLGLAFLPFIPSVANTTHIAPYEIRLYFLIYLLGTVAYLLNSWHAIIIQADQKQYITTTIISVAQMAQLLVQIAILLLTKNFYLYAGAYALSNGTRYLVARSKAFSMFPYLKGSKAKILDSKFTNEIHKNIKALIIHRMGFSITMAIECILLASMLGAATLGCFTNYQLVILGLATGIAILQKSFESSIGNLCTTEAPSYCYAWFNKINHVFSLGVGYCIILLIISFSTFFSLVYASAEIFPFKTTFLICMTQYLVYKRMIATVYESAYGIFYQDRFKPILQTLLSIVFSFLLCRYYGAAGIFAGIIISELLTSTWIEPYMVHKYGFHESMKPYWIDFIKNFSLLIISSLCAHYIMGTLHLSPFFTFLAGVAVATISYVLVMFLFFPQNAKRIFQWILRIKPSESSNIHDIFSANLVSETKKRRAHLTKAKNLIKKKKELFETRENPKKDT